LVKRWNIVRIEKSDTFKRKKSKEMFFDVRTNLFTRKKNTITFAWWLFERLEIKFLKRFCMIFWISFWIIFESILDAILTRFSNYKIPFINSIYFVVFEGFCWRFFNDFRANLYTPSSKTPRNWPWSYPVVVDHVPRTV